MQRKGRYSDKCIDFTSYTAPLFKIYPYNKCGIFDPSCGTMAFYSITGKSMDNKYKNRKVISDKVMVEQLRKYGYTVIPLSIANTISRCGIHNNITSDHVVLISQIMYRGEGSWAILHKNRYYHSFSTEPLRGMEFVNRPINTAYLIFKQEWAPKREPIVVKNGYKQLTLGNMTYLVKQNTYSTLQPYINSDDF